MPLTPGTWLNHYQILGHLGTGGMGEVYRALDNKLQREVALKVLPKAFAQDPERLARFRREAQVLAQLNHVNIAAIHNLEQSGETHFLVMELALGDTLRDRIKRSQSLRGSAAVSAAPGSQRDAGATSRPVPLEEALDICKQIAASLEHAHEKPIVHRDLKPANIKVTPEGVVKILDFGLARAFTGDSGSGDPADSPTLSAMTAPGTILGTAAYMSPEQARGKKVDKRTDIWALGCVLYEMLTGQQAFDPSRDRQGAGHPSRDREGAGVPLRANGQPPVADAPGSDENTIADIIGAILYKEPDWTALPSTTPHSVRVLLRRCLEKDAKRRLRDAADLQIQIEEAKATPTTSAPLAARQTPPRPAWRRVLLRSVAPAVLAGLTVGITIWNLRMPEPLPTTRTAITLPANVALASLDVPVVAISPDGNHLAYVGTRGGSQQLFIRALDSLEARPIAGTEGATMPFFSPDGQWLGFFAGINLKKVSTSGGSSVTVCNVTGAPRGVSWGTNDMIVLATTSLAGLSQVSAAGGDPQELTKLKEGEVSHRWPQLLPGGNAVLFTVQTASSTVNFDEAPIAVQQLGTGERKVLVQGGSYARYVPTGHLAYVRAGTLMAAPFDLERLEMTGPPVPVVEGVRQSALNGGAHFSISDQGSLLYIPGGARGSERALVWVDRKGMEQPIAALRRSYSFPRLSPDGQLLAVESQGDIWVYDLQRRTLSRLTFDGESNFPIWSPDGKRIVFRSAREGKAPNLFWKPADGSGPDERLTTAETPQWPMSWSPDGQVIGFNDSGPTTAYDMWVLPLSGERKPRVYLRTPFNDLGPKFSPDGHWLAYVSDESGRYEIYVQPFPGPGGKWQISTDGGTEPVWSRTGELFYRSDDRMMAVETKTQPTFSASTPRLLFEGQYERLLPAIENYAVTADGQRFVMVKAAGPEGGAPTQINVVLNWFEELKRRVPSGQ